MNEKVDDPVGVLASFAPGPRNTVRVVPQAIRWRGRRYRLGTMGLYHPERRGVKQIHIFEFSSGTIKFRLELDPETLAWTVVEVFYI
jgi:hypothetical protein